MIEIYKHVGGELGTSCQRILQLLEQSSDINDEDLVKQAKMEAREEYIAVTLLLKSDPKRYAVLVKDITNNKSRGIDGYPKSIATAYNMLVNYQNSYGNTRSNNQDYGIAFAQDDNNQDEEQTGRDWDQRTGG